MQVKIEYMFCIAEIDQHCMIVHICTYVGMSMRFNSILKLHNKLLAITLMQNGQRRIILKTFGI